MTGSLLLSLAPIAILIALGSWLRRAGFLGDSFWPHAEKLGYYILLPSLFLHGLATAHLDGVPILAMAAALACSTLAVAVLLVAVRARLSIDGPAFTSVFQGGVRFNNYVGVPVAAGLFGMQGVALAAVANATIVPMVNVLCVLVFARYGSQGRSGPITVARQAALNPLVLACVAGIGLQMAGSSLPVLLEPVLKALGQAALPLGLLCVGAAVEFKAARTWMRPLGVACMAKFALLPLVTLAACRVFDLHGAPAFTALLFQALPTSSASYVMARQLGGDAPLMAGIVAVQTALAGLLLPVCLVGLARWL